MVIIVTVISRINLHEKYFDENNFQMEFIN